MTLSARCPVGEAGGTGGPQEPAQAQGGESPGPACQSRAFGAGVCRTRPEPVQNTKINSVVQLALPVSVWAGEWLPPAGPVLSVQSSHSTGWAAEPEGVSATGWLEAKGYVGGARVWPAAGEALGLLRWAGPGAA